MPDRIISGEFCTSYNPAPAMGPNMTVLRVILKGCEDGTMAVSRVKKPDRILRGEVGISCNSVPTLELNHVTG